MRKLILSGDDWLELKHTLDLFVIETNNAANEYEKMAAHVRVAELSERYANLEKRDREKTENCKRLLALVESAERLPEDEGGRKMRTNLAERRIGYEPPREVEKESPEERRARIMAIYQWRKAMRRLARLGCIWLSGVGFALCIIAGCAHATEIAAVLGGVSITTFLTGICL